VGKDKRDVNWLLWGGFLTAVVATVSYIPVFVQFDATRDFPWANLLLFAVAAVLLGVGTQRAFTHPDRYRGRVRGVVLSVLSAALLALFCAGTFWFARQIPSANTALRVGTQAPDFTLTDTTGTPVSLAQLRQGHRAVLLIFYRGYW
jgi:cytochrome oxidase Cu insertion factor (SCO1/SenC/PrrC family)